MKTVKRFRDGFLLRGFLVSLGGYLLLFLLCFWELPLRCPPWQQALLLTLHAIPMFCLQLLLCRHTRAIWRVVVPIVVLAAPGAVFLSVGGWSVVAWVLFLFWCAAPVLGCVLGWLVWLWGEIRPAQSHHRRHTRLHVP